MAHALIVGDRGVGKSTLLRRVLLELGQPVFGFETKKEPVPGADGSDAQIFLYLTGEPRQQTRDNRVGYCRGGRVTAVPGAFDHFAPALLRPVPEGAVIRFDELGFLESGETGFCGAVLARLEGGVPVMAAVKERDTPFLQAVRGHPQCRSFLITRENRERLFGEVLDFMREQLQKAERRSGDG